MKTQLNSSEKEMFLAQAGEPESSKYCLLLSFRFPAVSAENLAAAFAKVAAATPVLRSHYALEGGEPVRVDDGAVPAVEIRDAADFAAVKTELAAFPHQRDLSVTPVRAVVFRLKDESVLGLSLHHIAFDGASSNLLVKSVESVLAGGEHLVQPTDNALPAPPAGATALYDEMFSSGVPVCEMPTKAARAKVHPFEDRELTVAWAPDEFAALVDAAHRLSVSAFELVFSAVGAVVAKYCGSEDVVLGTQVNSRDAAHKDAIGMFVNTGAVRLRPVRTDSFDDYVKATAALVRRVNHGEALPFSDVLSRYGVRTDPSRNPVFDVAVNWLPPQPERIYRVPPRESGAEKRARDLTLTFTRTKTDLSLLVSWPDELLDERVVANFAAQLKATLARAASVGGGTPTLPGEDGRASTPCGPLTVREALALPADQREMLAKFEVTAVAVPTETLLHRMFEKTAKANPEKTALVAVDRTLTFAELDAEADRVAANLQAKGVGKGDAVMLLLPRKSCFFSAMFGALKAGAAFIPCDPKYPAERINAIVSDADAKLVIDEMTFAGLAADGGKPSDPGVTGEDLAYMIYTSGSTGKPKGVMLRHAGICNYLRAHPANIHMDLIAREVTAYVSVTTVSFDMSFKEHCAALVNGKTLVFAGDDQMNDPEELARLIVANRADAINATPSRLLQYLECAAFRDALKGMKAVLSGGEGYPIALRDRLKTVTKARIVNTYGPTEITVSSNGADLTDAKWVTIGRPLLNYREWIADRFGDLAPFGVTGELWIGGIGVAKGYRNLPEQTAARFVEYEGVPVYKSGDLARWDADGNVLVFGRIDSQVKLRGLRIELDEIQALIASQPGIRNAAVLVRALNGQENLCAYYVADRKVDPAALRDELKKSLTSYMVPTAYLQLDEFPTTPNGKADLKSLPDAARLVEDLTAPETACQQRIFDVVAGVVGHRDFGVCTSFASAGLSSLGVVTLSVALGREFGIPFKIRDIHSNDTVVKMEGHLALAALAALRAVAGKPVAGRREDYPITKTQMGVFIECQAKPGTTVYNIPRLLKLGAGVDVARLVAALKATVDAHPYLKAHLFQDADGNVRARRRDDAEARVDVVEGPLPEPQSLVRPYDLLNDDLYRIAIFRTEKASPRSLSAPDSQLSASNYLFVDFSHIASDGESDAIFFRDLNRAYAGETPEPEEFTGFEAAQEEAEALKTDAFAKAKAHYEALFTGCEPECQPAFDTEIGEEGAGRVEGTFGIPFESVRKFCREKGVSENALFNAVFAFVLAKYAGRKDAIYATVYNGRSDSRTANAVSMFVKTLPVWCDLDDGRKVVDVVKGMGEQLVASMASDLFSFADVAKTYGVRSDVMFVYQGEAGGFDRVGGEPCESVPLHLDQAKALIDFQVWAKDGRVEYFCEYDRVNYSEWLLKGFAECFGNTLAEFLAKETLGDVAVCSAAQLARLDGFNETGVAYDGPKTVVGLFRQSVERFPDNIAVVHLDKQFTYRQVDEMSDRIAAHLRAKGIVKEDLVAVLIPRCEYMTIASLGVSKAGAAYQPLDPSYPPERLAYMVGDTQAKLLIADESLLDRLPDYKGEILLTKDIPSLPDVSSRREEILSWSPSPEDAFIILYTSGSTGKPKGAILEHRCLVNFCNWYPRYFDMGPDARVAAYASYGFDACMMDMYPTLAVGATIYIVDDSIRLDLDRINAYFTEVGITHSFMTTQVCRQFAQVTTAPSLRHLTASGEKLVPIAPPNGFRFYNGGGPTECTIYVAAFQVEKTYRRVPLGYPLANLKAYVVDERGRRLPPGVPGELWVSSVQISRHYLNNPEKTAAAYGVNPFTQEEGYARIYRTGDICRIQEDGLIDILGRRDGMVKVRGFRIELSEVEEIVRRFPGVKDATVQAYDSPAGGKYICAYVVGDAKIDVEAMNAFILAEKPPYLVPAVTMQIDEIPLNQNQKVDRRKLPMPQAQRAAYVAPETDAEKAFCEAMANILGLDQVSATDDFFEIGGSSIAAISLMAKANAAGYPVTYANVFALRTPRALAEFASGGAAVTKTEAPNVIGVDFNAYDHAAIGRLLGENTLESFRAGELHEVGNALFTGATGFMGIHLLARFLEVEKGMAYCLVRKGKYPTAGRRLRNLFHYYFEERYDEALASRVEVFDGDVTDPSSFDPLLARQVDTVFNCAANVKHFSSGTDIEDVNIGGAKAVIAFCLKSGARLVHFSTSSVQGFVPEKDGRPSATLDERTAYMGQKLPTKYANSKMIAELEVFKAVLEKGLSAKVIRLGWLSPRERDGEFQINFRTNAFMGTLRAYATLGCYPYSRLAETVPTDPIDSGAAAYLKLAKTPERCRLFHATNYDTVPMGSIIRMMNAAGVKVDFVEDEVYDAALDKALENPANAGILQPLLAYRGSQGDVSLVRAAFVNGYTTQVLARLGHYWKAIGEDYIESFVKAIRDLSFFG